MKRIACNSLCLWSTAVVVGLVSPNWWTAVLWAGTLAAANWVGRREGEYVWHCRVVKALTCAVRHGGTEESWHKAWVIDQMVRALAGSGYAKLVQDAKAGEDGPETYAWDEGIGP